MKDSPSKRKPEQEDSDFLNDSREAILNQTSRGANLILYLLLALILIGITWAHFAVLDEVTEGQGKVIPSSKIKVIQNLEGGIVKSLLVREGETVKKGQVLMRLEDTRFKSEFREKYSNYLVLLAEISRLKAESQGKKSITYPELVKKDAPDLVKQENALFDNRQKDLEDGIKVMKDSLALAQKELDITKPLADEQVVSKIELFRLQREVNELKGRMRDERGNFQAEAHSELNHKRASMEGLKESLLAIRDRMQRTTVVSPVEGIVKQINTNTIGGVIKPGMDIMEIVPLEDTLLVEANVKPADIAFIHPGDAATVKISAYDFAIYGGLDAKVESISADTITDEYGNSFYRVLVRTDKNYLGKKNDPLPIIPGMTASVNIITGHKSVLTYLMKPLLRAKAKALSER